MEDYEKKYKKICEWIKSIYPELTHEHQMQAEAFLPEFKENEDERIRKRLIGHLKECRNHTESEVMIGEYAEWIAWLEKQSEQKPVDKVEPKFKVGDWIIDKQGIVHQIERVVENVTNHTFGYDVVEGGYFNDSIEGVHLWTIEDAKDGDVLANCFIVCIFKGLDEVNNVITPCVYTVRGGFEVIDIDNDCIGSSGLKPATKEQRDLLFSKMKEAGYEWDAEKKELKKIEQKPVEPTDRDAEKASEDYRNWRMSCGVSDPVALNEIEEAFYQGAISRQPYEWSGEDKEMLDNTLINLTELLHRFGSDYGRIGECIDWLKSLRPQKQWKPSEEQLKAIKLAITFVTDDFSESPTLSETLNTLLEQLKQL